MSLMMQHASIAQPSLCTAKTIRSYFVNGTLPEPGTICEPDVKLFSEETLDEVLAPLANLTKRSFGTEDAMLLTAVKSLGGKFGRAMIS